METTIDKLNRIKNEVSNLNKNEFDDLISYLNDINKNRWLNNFITRNKNIDISEEEILSLVKESRKEIYESSN